jgi:alkylation response protein AidB-like acyl-CoA dehydrogenase
MKLLTEDQIALRDACRDVLAEQRTSEHLRAVADSATGFDDAHWTSVTELGWPALVVPDAFDGLDAPLADAAVVAGELGRTLQPSPLVPGFAATLTVAASGSDALRERLLPAVADGTAVVSVGPYDVGAFPILEPAANGYTLRGRIGWVPDAPSATHVLVTARTPDGAVRTVLLDSAAVGVLLTPITAMDLTRRYGHVECHDVPIGVDDVLAEDAAGRLFDTAVVLQCAETVGVMARALELTVRYAGQRQQFGQLIGSFQAIKHAVADMLIESEAARAMTWEATEHVGTPHSTEATSAAKSVTGRAGVLVTGSATQVHGGIGFTWEHDLHLYVRRAKANAVLLGTPAWHERRLADTLRSTARTS